MNELRQAKNIGTLIDSFLKREINSREFCDEFYLLYDLGGDDSYNDKDGVLDLLSEVAGRYSEFEDDRVDHPNAYSSDEELIESVKSVKSSMYE
jgi:hypothetical protein